MEVGFLDRCSRYRQDHKSGVQTRDMPPNKDYRSGPGTWSVVLVWWHFPCLYPSFVYKSQLWRRVGQERQGITKVGYRQGKSHQTRTTDQVPGTWSVVLVWWHFPCLYPSFVYKSPLWRRVGQERQGTDKITKVGYRQGKCHQTRTTDEVPGTATDRCGRHMRITHRRWAA